MNKSTGATFIVGTLVIGGLISVVSQEIWPTLYPTDGIGTFTWQLVCYCLGGAISERGIKYYLQRDGHE